MINTLSKVVRVSDAAIYASGSPCDRMHLASCRRCKRKTTIKQCGICPTKKTTEGNLNRNAFTRYAGAGEPRINLTNIRTRKVVKQFKVKMQVLYIYIV